MMKGAVRVILLAASMVAGLLDRLSKRTDVLEEPAEGNGAYPVG